MKKIIAIILWMFVVAVPMWGDTSVPLCFTAKRAGATVKFNIRIGFTATIQTSRTNNGTDWANYTSGSVITLTNVGDKVYFRAANQHLEAFDGSNFAFTDTIESSGNTMSLYGPTCPNIALPGYAFRELFENASYLLTPPELPATNLGYQCYEFMFRGCTSLTTAPALPATTLAENCYTGMFSRCTSLTTAPTLPATTLAEGCYLGMFHECTSLTTAPALPATTLARTCYNAMFCECTSLTTPPSLPATTLADWCYASMFWGCTSLTTPPALPATTLADSCYEEMFSGCTSIQLNINPPGLPWSIPATATPTDAVTDMFTGTSGTMNGTPTVNTTYYIVNDATPPVPTTVTITAQSASTTMGSVTGGGTYNSGDTVTLTATAFANYHFVRWSNGMTSSTIKFAATSDTTIMAFFDVNVSSECLDYTDLTSNSVVCTYGRHHFEMPDSTPYDYVGVHPDRHVVNRRSGMDPFVYGLSILPPNGTTSVRLGDYNTGGYAESITYNYYVSSSSKSILMFNYAAVMENPSDHSLESQPRVKLEVLDQNDAVIDQCYSFDFMSDSSLGWNTTYILHIDTLGDTIPCVTYWKDWTSIGMDFSSYVGQTIRIRITNYDCLQAGHLGYIYYDITCADKTIENISCGDVSTTTLVAPAGFEYAWHLQNSSIIVSRQQTYQAPLDGNTYVCDVSQVGKPSCYFQLSAISEVLRPVADFQVSTTGQCVDTLSITNTSFVSNDGINPIVPWTGCDDYYWDFGDGRTSTAENPGSITYRYSGTYTITLRASIMSGSCWDSISKTVTVRGQIDTKTIANTCDNTPYQFCGNSYSAPGTYYGTTTVGGCTKRHELVLSVSRSYMFPLDATICNNEPYNFRGRTYSTPGVYYDSLRTANGCDSIYKLTLHVNQARMTEKDTALCTSSGYSFAGRLLTESGVYYDSLRTATGCDSIIKLVLTIGKETKSSRYVEICQGDSFLYRNKVIKRQGIYRDSLTNMSGCDSIIELIFNILPNYYFRDTVTICEGSYYNFHGRMVTNAGTYRDSLTTAVSGCDSIYELHLKTAPRFHNIQYETLCSDSVFVWRQKYLTESGTYFDSLISHSGCDSVYELRLTMNRPQMHTDHITVCEGDSFYFRGRSLTRQGIYYDTLMTTRGCDSIYKLVFNVMRSYYFRDTVKICQGDAYNFRGRMLTHAGTYRDSLRTSVGGCDSIYELYLETAPRFHDIKHDTVCSNDLYLWRGRYLTGSGTYRDTISSVHGCDSIYELQLIMDTNYLTTIHETICQGAIIVFNGRQISESGVYTDTLMRSIRGCDSVVRLVVSVVPTYEKIDTVDICGGDTFMFHGRSCTVPGTYRHTSPSSGGSCDSLFTMVLRVHNQFYDVLDTTLCSGSVLTLHGVRMTQTDTYYARFKDRYGCDSVYEMHVTFNPVSRNTIYKSICSMQTYTTHSGRILNKTGIYYDTLVSRNGCDSILTIILNVYSSILIDDTLQICRGEQAQSASGSWYGLPGVYLDTVNRNPSYGCDTVYRTHVSYHYEEITLPHVWLCPGELYRFNGKEYNESGSYLDTIYYTTPGKCDEIYTINVTAYPRQDSVINVTTCEGAPYWFAGELRQKSGTYIDTTHKTVNGCDSIVTLKLLVVDRIDSSKTVNICEGDTYTWHGKNYSKDGVYRDTLVNAQTGCNEYHTLTLVTIQETRLIDITGYNNEASICQDEYEYLLHPTFSGATPTSYTLRYDGVAIPSRNDIEDAPYDGTSTIEVPMPRDADGNPVKPGRYVVTMVMDNGFCDASSHAKDFYLTVKYPSSVLEQHFDDVVSVLNDRFNGGYVFSGFKWYVNGTLANGMNESNLYQTSLKPYDEVYAELQLEGETEWIPTCPLTIVDFTFDESAYPVFVTVENMKARLTAREAARYMLCTFSGAVIGSGTVEMDGEVELDLPYVSGCYLLVVDAETAGRKVFKVIVR